MGKSNRIRVNRVDTRKVATPKKKQKGMPSWAITLLTVVITVAIVCSAVLLALSSNGVFGRMKTAMKSEDYKVNQNTFSYFFKANYANFQTEYESYLNYFSLDTTKSLKDQPYGGSEGDYAYEYSENHTLSPSEETLANCEFFRDISEEFLSVYEALWMDLKNTK